MFTANELLSLVKTRPFEPFRLVLSDGGTIDVLSPEVVSIGRHRTIIGLLDPNFTDTFYDRWTIVWYMHVTRVELLKGGPSPSGPPPGPAQSPTPSAV